jgi:hypothetical protein
MPFFTILGLDNANGNITANYFMLLSPVCDCIDHLKEVPYEPIECENMTSNSRDCFKSWLETVDRTYRSLHLSFRLISALSSTIGTLKAPPPRANALLILIGNDTLHLSYKGNVRPEDALGGER